MKSFILALATVAVGLLGSFDVQAQTRYLEPVFGTATKSDTVFYGESVRYNGDTVQLYMYVYTPDGDTATNRPLVVLAHGGSFTGGDPDVADVAGLCDYLAKCGFVCASISYRLTIQSQLFVEDNVIQTVVRAVQDGKAAVRYLRANGPSYKLDTTRVYFGGSSAGAILAYQLGYMNDYNELPTQWQTLTDAVGGIDGTSGTPGHRSEVQAVFGYAGALGDTSWIKAGDIPFMGMHSTGDATVPYGYGNPLVVVTPKVYGTSTMKVRADNIGVNADFYSYNNGAHPPYGAGGTPGTFDSALVYTSRFLHKMIATGPVLQPLDTGGTTGISNRTLASEVKIYPNPNQGSFIVSAVNSKAYTVNLYDLTGRLIKQEAHVQTPTVKLNVADGIRGTYIVEVKDDETGANLLTSKLIVQ